MWNLFIVESEAIPTFAVFCCLDWNRFELIFDFACHSGLVSDCHSVEADIKDSIFAEVEMNPQIFQDPVTLNTVKKILEPVLMRRSCLAGRLMIFSTTNSETI